MLYVTYVKPFNTNLRNFACIFSELGLVACHASLFAFISDDPNLGEKYFKNYSHVFAIILLITIAGNAIFLVADTYYPLLKLGVILNIIDESALKDPNANRVIEEFSDSDDSMTERDVTIGSNEVGKYGADYNEDKIEYVDPKDEERRLKKIAEMKSEKKKIIKKKEEPLVSNFGPKTIPLANIPEPIDEEEDKKSTIGNIGNKTAVQPQAKILTPVQIKDPNATSATPIPSGFVTQPLQPIEEEKRLDESKSSEEKDNKESKESTQKEANLLTPAVSQTPGGFTGGEFEKALKDAKSKSDYNFLPYKKD